MDEFRLIESLLQHRGADVAGMRVGPGDDAAVLRPPAGSDLVVTTDAQIEHIHFEWDWLTPKDVGYRAAMACHSDLAAMGAGPWTAFSSLGIPAGTSPRRVRAVQQGLHKAFKELGAALGGGNVARAPDAFSVTLAAIGLVPRGDAVKRLEARPGDAIWCSGAPGTAALGRHELVAGRHRSAPGRAFRRPVARIALGKELRRRRLVTAMIDISDGLAGDLRHLLGPLLGAGLEREALYPDPNFARRCQRVGKDPEALVLGGGEDYELLFTVPRSVSSARILAAGRRANVPVRRVGGVTNASAIRLTGGGKPARAVRVSGFRHNMKDVRGS